MALNIPTEGTRLNELKINIVDTQETFMAMQTANKVNANELYFIEQELPIAADSLKTGHTFKVNLASENASTAFNGTADITDIGVSGTLPVKHGGTGFTTATYKNAVVIGNSSTVTNQLQTIRTAPGAFYATGQDAKPSFGTLPIAQGGTGQTSIANIQAGKDSAGNTITSTYLKLSGGNMTGHIYLTGSQANSSTANTSQLIFGTPTTEHIAISSNTKALILNPTHSSTTNQIVLYLDKASKFPFGIEANVKGNLTGKATTAGTADIANSVAWNNVSSKPTTLSGYGITDAKINNGTITLGNNSITPLTSHQSLSGYIPKSTLSGAFDIMYSTSANTPARLGANTTTTKKFLSMTGTGSTGAAPVWSTVTQSDVGLSNVENTKLSTWTGSSKITTVGTLSSGTVPWARLSNIPTTFTPAAHTHGPSDLTGLKTLTIGSSSCQVFADADINIPIYNGTIENTLLAAEGVSF